MYFKMATALLYERPVQAEIFKEFPTVLLHCITDETVGIAVGNSVGFWAKFLDLPHFFTK